MRKTILITGGYGFIASNFIPYLMEKHPEYHIINIDSMTYAADKQNLHEIEHLSNYHWINCNIADWESVMKIFQQNCVNHIIHFAAESHVDNSIRKPDIFIKTNILGTFHLLHAAMKQWMESPFAVKEQHKESRFLHISTDEVFGSLEETGFFTEKTPYAPNSPYSASKASSDMLVRAYHHTYGMNTVITNCSNNYGPKQHQEKLIPTIIRKAIKNEPIPIYGDGKNIRDWLYVLDHCKGIDIAFHKGISGETYNIGGKNERKNLYIAEKICSILEELAPEKKKNISKYQDLITLVEDRPGHDRRYAIDASKIENELGWKAEENFESGIRKTVQWYLKYFKRHH